MKAYLAVKFKEDYSNKVLIEELSSLFQKLGIETRVMVRDYEEWGKKRFVPADLMKLALEEIDTADCLIVEFSEKGVGLGIEAGYAYAKQKPIHVIAKTGSEISDTLRGLATRILFYENPKDLLISF